MCSGRVKLQDRVKEVPEMWSGRDGGLAPRSGSEPVEETNTLNGATFQLLTLTAR